MSARNCSKALLAVFVVAGLFVGARSTLRAPINTAAWLIALAFAAAQVLLIWLVVRRHPGRPANPAFVWIGLLAGMAGGIAIPTNSAISNMQSKFGLPSGAVALLTPSAEETAKGLAVLLVAVGWLSIRRPIEATVLGIAVGGGFSTMENISYIAYGALDSFTSDESGALFASLQRLASCPFSHGMYTGLAAWGVGCFLARTDKSLGWRVGQMAAWFALGFAVHGIYNAIPAVAENYGDEASGYAVIAALGVQWALAIWLYLRSRKIGKRAQASVHAEAGA